MSGRTFDSKGFTSTWEDNSTHRYEADGGEASGQGKGTIHEAFPPQGRSQPAHLGSQSSVPDKDIGEPESGRINN